MERLRLLSAATRTGHSIGNIARLPTESLRKLVASESNRTATTEDALGATMSNWNAATDALNKCLRAVRKMSAADLEATLSKSAVQFGQHGLLEKVVASLVQRLGDSWRDGTVTAAHEPFASAVLRAFLLRNSKAYAAADHVPALVVATRAGQIHELGAGMVAAAAQDMGWRVIYLGTSLPAAEIAGAATQHKARSVALSIVFPGDEPNLALELDALRRLLPPEVAIIAGGRAAQSYSAALHEIGAAHTRDLRECYCIWEGLRLPSPNKSGERITQSAKR